MTEKLTDETRKQPTRWSATRKMEIVLRYLKGESLDSLSREIGIAAFQIEQWHQKAIQAISLSLKARKGDPLQKDLDLAKKRIGELSMENELLKEKSRKQGVFWEGKW